MTKRKTTEVPALADMVRAAYDVALFRRESGDAKRDAQRNLDGRTHYVDPDTLRYFHSRIVAGNVSSSGLIYWIVESVAADPNNSRRGFRPVAFDVFGTVLHRDGIEHLDRTSDQSRKAFYAWLESFDVAAHYKALMTRDADKAKARSAALARAARAVKL